MIEVPTLDPLRDSGEFFVRYIPENVERFDGLVAAVQDFDAGDRPAAKAATQFLKGIDIARPLESLTRLYFLDGQLVGFYSLANGAVKLSKGRLKSYGLTRGTQPAVILTWIAKSRAHSCDGAELVRDAVDRARMSEVSAATVLALDAFDDDTAAMWRREYGFVDATGPTEDGKRPRLVVPLRDPRC